MTNVEETAMWVEANISYQAAWVILKHLNTKFNFSVQVPFNQIALLSDISPSLHPTFGKFNFKKKGEEMKVGENIKDWTIALEQFLQTNFSRLLSCRKYYHHMTFQYNLLTGIGINCLIGTDHGTGKSRYPICLNYLLSSSCCQHNCVDFGTQTYQFAEVNCKKDTTEIQNKIAPVINEAIKSIKDSKLMVFKSNKQVECILLPKACANIRTSIAMSTVLVHYDLRNKSMTKLLHIPAVDTVTPWTGIFF